MVKITSNNVRNVPPIESVLAMLARAVSNEHNYPELLSHGTASAVYCFRRRRCHDLLISASGSLPTLKRMLECSSTTPVHGYQDNEIHDFMKVGDKCTVRMILGVKDTVGSFVWAWN